MLLSDLEEAVVDASSSAPPNANNNGTEMESAAESDEEDKAQSARQPKKSGNIRNAAGAIFFLKFVFQFYFHTSIGELRMLTENFF